MSQAVKKTSPLSRLQVKLTLTYTLVTVSALLAMELLFLGAVFVSYLFTNNDRIQYVDDARYTMQSQASRFLNPEIPQPIESPTPTPSVKSALPKTEPVTPTLAAPIPDLNGLQTWLDGVYDLGRASAEPNGPLDSPAALLVPDSGLYVLDAQGKILAASPKGLRSQIGQNYLALDPTFADSLWPAVENQRWDTNRLMNVNRSGDYLLAAPVDYTPSVPEGTMQPDALLLGVVVVTIEPAPPFYTLLPTILAGLGVIAGTGLLLIIAVIPFGALFGFIMARGLTRRLAALTEAADAWSQGDFSARVQDRSADEIGVLSDRLRHMAEQVQSLLQNRRDLAAVEERNRLARELHDAVKQQIFATHMQIRAARNLLPAEPSAARALLGEAEGLIKSTQQELNLLIGELRPAALGGQGLTQAVRIFLDTWSKNSGINTNLQVQGERSLSLGVEQALYRVAQEALSNVARHSGASAVSIRLDYTPAQVSLQIGDNGVGFDPSQAAAGFGLSSMRQRIEEQGGTLTIESQKEQGTTLTAAIPTKEGAR